MTTMVTVTAGEVGFISCDGTPEEGQISFQPIAETKGEGSVVTVRKVTMAVAGGQIVPPNTLIGGITYVVNEYWSGIEPEPYNIVVDSTNVDMSAVERVAVG